MEQDAEWAAPLLWRSEFRNVLALYLRKQLISRTDALEAFHQAEQLVQGREYTVETEPVLDLVSDSACSAYDCEFVWLAEHLQVPLITSDGRVLGAFPNIAVTPATFSASSPL